MAGGGLAASPGPDESELRGGGRTALIAHRTADGLGIPVAEGIAVVRDKDSRYASTAHTVQENAPRLPRRLPATAGVVQARVRPVVGGDRPSSRRRPRHRKALVAARSAAQLSAFEGAPGPGRRPGPRSPVHRLRRLAGEAARDHSGRNARKAHIWVHGLVS